MGERRQSLLVWSGIYAFLSYCLVLLFLIFELSSVFTKKYAPRADTILERSISVDLSVFEPQDSSKQDSGTHLEGMGVRDIFSTIPDTTTTAKEQGDNRSQNAKNTKNKKDRDKLKSIQDSLNKLNSNLNAIENKALNVQSQSISPEFADGEYNEWFGKIYDIIYQKWQSKYYQDAEVTALLRITNTGAFHYRITRLSRYEDYNQNIIALLESLKGESFPPYPKGKMIEIEVNFRLD